MNTKRASMAVRRFGRMTYCLLVWLWLGSMLAPAHAQRVQLASPGTSLPSSSSEFLKLRPQCISAAELAKALQLIIGTQGSLAVLESQDVVLVAGPPDVLQRAAYLLEQVDTPRLQVRLAVYLFDVELSELKQLGLAANNQINASSDNILKATGQFQVLSSQLELNQMLKLLSECAGAKLLADPQLTIVDRQTSAFNILTRIPVEHGVSTDRNGPTGSTGYEEVGVKLAITPRIANSSTVELHIAPQYSSVAGFNSQGNPIIESRSAETTVRVAQRQTLVLGGLRKRHSTEPAQPASGLVNRKVVEPWFRSASSETTESELLCIVRTEIVDRATTQTQEAVQQSANGTSAPPSLLPTPGLITSALPASERIAAVQNGAYQETSANPGVEPVNPSAYRPSVYVKPSASQRSPRRNINTSRNSVTQPLSLPSRQSQ